MRNICGFTLQRHQAPSFKRKHLRALFWPSELHHGGLVGPLLRNCVTLRPCILGRWREKCLKLRIVMKAVKSDEIWTLDNHALTLFDCTLKSILAELSSVN